MQPDLDQIHRNRKNKLGGPGNTPSREEVEVGGGGGGGDVGQGKVIYSKE